MYRGNTVVQWAGGISTLLLHAVHITPSTACVSEGWEEGGEEGQGHKCSISGFPSPLGGGDNTLHGVVTESYNVFRFRNYMMTEKNQNKRANRTQIFYTNGFL